MISKEHKLLAEAYSKVYIQESSKCKYKEDCTCDKDCECRKEDVKEDLSQGYTSEGHLNQCVTKFEEALKAFYEYGYTGESIADYETLMSKLEPIIDKHTSEEKEKNAVLNTFVRFLQGIINEGHSDF